MPSGWKIANRLKPHPRVEVLAIVGVALVAFVITLVVTVSSAGVRSRRAAAQASDESARSRRQPLLTAAELDLGYEDFILPPLNRPPAEPQYVPFRPRLTRWSASLAAKYWVSPRDIAAEIVGSINDQNMQRLFQDVP